MDRLNEMTIIDK